MTARLRQTFQLRVSHSIQNLVWSCLLLSGIQPSHCLAQLPPEIGYLLPAGAQRGTTVDVVLGGYDWTPDMQLFVSDPRVTLILTGPPSDVLITEPPYWFGYKARGYAWPLPREFPAKLTIPADVPTGLIRWQVANANGASASGFIHIGDAPDIAEDRNRKTAQVLPALPVTVSGQIRRIEEVDRYKFRVNQTGPVTIELFARRLGSPLHGMLTVKDSAGQVVLDVADTEGRDLTATMLAVGGVDYEIALHDLDFAGDRSYVYRMTVKAAPQVVAAFPAAGKRGETTAIEFVGYGVKTGSAALESVTQQVQFPAAAEEKSFEYSLETPWGISKPFPLLVSDIPESVKQTSGNAIPSIPGAVTGSFETRFGTDNYAVALTKGQTWDVAAQSRSTSALLDLELAIVGPDGKAISSNDDTPGATDSAFTFTAPADGTYQVAVTDRSGRGGTRGTNYRLSFQAPRENIELTFPPQFSIPINTKGKLTVKCSRQGGFKGEIPVALTGLPEGVSVPENLVIPADKPELAIELSCSENAPATASLCVVTMTPVIGGQTVTRRVGTVLVATTLKPRFKLTPEGLDDVRKVHRGSTFLFPMLIERLEGYQGPITLEMTAKQQRHRQGLASDELIVPPDALRVDYPIFVPEWMETTKTSRMILNGSAKIADPRGNVRTVLQRQELRFGILPEGALMKLTHRAGEVTATAGSEIVIPLALSVASELKDPIQVEFVPSDDQKRLFSAPSIVLQPGQKEGSLIVTVATDVNSHGEHELLLRATTVKDGLRVASETTVVADLRPKP